MARKLGKNYHGCSVFEPGCASGVLVGPTVRSRGRRAERKLVGLRRMPMLVMRRQGAFRIEHQGASLERLHRLSDSRFDVRTRFSLLAREGGARNLLRPLCFPGRSPSAWEGCFCAISRIARVAALPASPALSCGKKSKIRACANECVPLLYFLATRTWLSW